MGDPETLNGKEPVVQPEPAFLPISVVVISYNEEKNIRDCLDSLARQDYPDERYEIVVVDSSIDSTPEIAASYKKVRLLRAPKGYSIQKNRGIEAARFNIVAFTDADCLIPSGWLRVINAAFKNPRIAAIGGNAYPPPGTSRFGRWSACVGHPAGGAIGFDANVTRGPEGVSFVPGCNSCFRKDALLDAGGFGPEFFDGGEDVDISRRLRKKGYYLDYIPELTVFHKPRPNLSRYLLWNVTVGVTKYNLQRPSLLRTLVLPGLLLSSALLLAALIVLSKSVSFFLLSSGSLWIAFLIVLLFAAKPYRLLVQRRKRIGVSWLAVGTAVPFLIALRQVGISLGQLKKRRALRKGEERSRVSS
jgi:GT2 family glycosyltransferase